MTLTAGALTAGRRPDSIERATGRVESDPAVHPQVGTRASALIDLCRDPQASVKVDDGESARKGRLSDVRGKAVRRTLHPTVSCGSRRTKPLAR